MSSSPLCRTLLRSLPLAVAHEAIALYEMQVLLSRLTPAIFISLGNPVAGRCNVSGTLWFLGLCMCDRETERDCCETPNRNTQEQRSRHHFALTFVHFADAVSLRRWNPSAGTFSSPARGCQCQAHGVAAGVRGIRRIGSLHNQGVQRWSAPIARFAELNLSTIISSANLSSAWPSVGSCKVIWR